MLNDLEKEISLSEEYLNGLPNNNEKNQKKLLEEIDLEINNYNAKLEEIVKECKNRLSFYENVVRDEIPDNSQTLLTLKSILRCTNSLSTPYEKLKFDKVIFQLSHFHDDDLINNNRKILKAVNGFRTAGVSINHKDFNYTSYVSKYMKMFFEPNLTLAKIKDTFDDIYWQCPELMTQIELNLRYLYLKNKSVFEKYIESFSKKIKQNFVNGEATILEDYNYLRKKDSNFISKNNLILDFYSQKMDIDEYTDEKIFEIKSRLFRNVDDIKIDLIFQLLNSLKEYKEYLKYQDLIDKVKEISKENLEKGYLNKSLKKIKDLEKKLFKLNKKNGLVTSKTKVGKLEPEINNIIDEIKKLYDEIDTNMFKIIVKEHIKDNSTIFKVLLLFCQYYAVTAGYFKETDPEINYTEIDEKYLNLYNFTMDPNNTMINNIMAMEDINLSDIIITNYKMLDVKIDDSILTDDALEGLISDLEKIVVNHMLKKLDISIDGLKSAKSIKSSLEKNNAM